MHSIPGKRFFHASMGLHKYAKEGIHARRNLLLAIDPSDLGWDGRLQTQAAVAYHQATAHPSGSITRIKFLRLTSSIHTRRSPRPILITVVASACTGGGSSRSPPLKSCYKATAPPPPCPPNSSVMQLVVRPCWPADVWQPPSAPPSFLARSGAVFKQLFVRLCWPAAES